LLPADVRWSRLLRLVATCLPGNDLGPITVDCDVLTVAGSDLRVVALTAPPGTEDADKLWLLAVIGQQQMTEPSPT